MNVGPAEFQSAFRLKPTRAAKVSEISEATAAASVDPHERVNFHIGNPVQDERLSAAYLRAILGLDISDTTLSGSDQDALIRALGWGAEQRPFLELLNNLVARSGPYLPRGGFSRTSPPPLANAFGEWLQSQQEPLTYDIGKTTGRREVIFASGGITETLRVFFHAVAAFLANTPARVALFRASLPPHVTSFSGLLFTRLPNEEPEALQALRTLLIGSTGAPTFVLLGEVISEEARRSLRELALAYPIMFLEINDSPNHLSLAREAKLIDRVIRFLTPGIFSRKLHDLPIVFVAGNADYLVLLETIHFQLKGTPSASEVELVSYVIRRTEPPAIAEEETVSVEPPMEQPGFSRSAENILGSLAFRAEEALQGMLSAHEHLTTSSAEAVGFHARRLLTHRTFPARLQATDKFQGLDAAEVLEEVTRNLDNPDWILELQQTFLARFNRHHPEYELSSCAVVSGSARTALSLLGFHCGIQEAIIPDFSWTYEHCFPSVHAVPLTSELALDADGMIAAVEGRIALDPEWTRRGAVVLNNPHNATGRVFDNGTLRSLLQKLLSMGVTVIDDLSYQYVAPVDDLPSIPSLCQIAEELVTTGRLSSEASARLITVHSLSKTDCLAGARVSVIEIRHPVFRSEFLAINSAIRANLGAILMGYLFYRNPIEVPRAYWRLRNRIFHERMSALSSALQNLPADRNTFGIQIIPPAGSMYPLMVIERLPAGLSLEWVASRLAALGIGLIPLTTFARSEKAFEMGRKAFRLTLGGSDGAPELLAKTRRVIIDLNRLVDEESERYNLQPLILKPGRTAPADLLYRWEGFTRRLQHRVGTIMDSSGSALRDELKDPAMSRRFTDDFVPERLAVWRQRLLDRSMIIDETIARVRADRGRQLTNALESEFSKDDLGRRLQAFHERPFDRTVHPTQMYSLRTETVFDAIIAEILNGQVPQPSRLESAATALTDEFLGMNVAISSVDEAEEILLDLDAYVMAELFADLQEAGPKSTFLSFWGDWDGSNRPSGQGHLLVASVLLRNVERLSRLLHLLTEHDHSVGVYPALLAEMEQLPDRAKHFDRLMRKITSLTHHLERRYRGILPFQVQPRAMRRVGMALHLARDPITSLWHHNDRLERRMLDLRRKRRDALEYSLAVNKRLRKQLRELIPAIVRNLDHPLILREAALYRDLLKRFVITPRIHQNIITAQDPFAIDTTVFNMVEIDAIGGRYGNPGMVLALQVSMSTKPEALIELDRKVRARREHILRDEKDANLPPLRLVPLFEDQDSVRDIDAYLSKMWEYALQSRRLNQETGDRFSEMIGEVFIAGSDLSQQMSQAAGAQLYHEAKHKLYLWLAGHGLAHRVRLKLGSGEPMQRQGGYYSEVSGAAAFVQTDQAIQRFTEHLRESTRRSTLYATTPMMGIFSGGDLRTVQSALAERLRHLGIADFTRLLHHLRQRQQKHLRDLIRASEELSESRMKTTSRGEQALERLTVGPHEQAIADFLPILTEHFRQILYGREEDVVGIHLISYFIARTTPPLRDRPTVRASQEGKGEGSQILERIAEMIPFSRYGSRLRAIAHNQAQTAVLGINQLTTGLFRALDAFSQQGSVEGDPDTFLADRILPHLPVYEILQSLRLFHDTDLRHLSTIERAFPAGNSAFIALREDVDAMTRYIPLFQQELLRRHGIDVTDFFEGPRFMADLLPTLRPDLSVLLQSDIFNSKASTMLQGVTGRLDPAWEKTIERLLKDKEEIRAWRSRAWALLERPVFQRVEAFVELALALHSLSSKNRTPDRITPARDPRLPSRLDSFFRMSRADDEMRQFLAAATEYLMTASEGMMEVPPTIIRALKDVERIAKIEQQALTSTEQNRLRFYLLQIARLAGDNG